MPFTTEETGLSSSIVRNLNEEVKKSKLDRVVDFINNFKLELTHIHPNNFGGIDLNKNPKVIELTFERNPLIIDNKLILPNHLDEKNNQQENDISLTFY
jgi:hypothetical protein